MRFYFLLYFTACFSPLLIAQDIPEDLKEQSSILWATLSYTDYPLDAVGSENFWKTMKAYQLTDLQRPSGNLFKKQLLYFESQQDSDFLIAQPTSFSNRLFEAITTTNIPIFKGPSCEKELSAADREEVLYLKGQLKNSKKVTYTARHSRSMEMVWRLCHWLYYDQATKQFSSRPLAIAPLEKSLNEDGSYTLGKPLFWLPVNHSTTELPNARLLFQTVRGLHLADAQKSWGDQNYASTCSDFFTHLEEVERPFWQSSDYKEYEPLSSSDLKSGLSSTDTLSTFDPKTFEKTVHIKSYNCLDNPAECFPGIALQHRWAWDGQQLWIQQKAWGFQRLLAVGKITYAFFWQSCAAAEK